VIPRAHVTAWRAKAPWASDAQVEQDLVVSRAIVELFSDESVAQEVAFRGGTALHKLHFDPPGRYSEDIDLVQVTAGPIGRVMDAIRGRFDPWLGEPQWKRGPGGVSLVYRFESETRPITPLRLKLEINTREHFFVLGPRRMRFEVENPWHSAGADVLTYARPSRRTWVSSSSARRRDRDPPRHRCRRAPGARPRSHTAGDLRAGTAIRSGKPDPQGSSAEPAP
jgi:hypothetical protein